MPWHYQVRRRKHGDKWRYDIVEAYPTIKSWTASGMTPQGGSRKELITELENMLADAKKYKTLTDKGEDTDVQNVNDESM